MDLTYARISVTTLSGMLLAYGAGGVFDRLQWPIFVAVGIVGTVALLTASASFLARVGALLLAAVLAGAATVVLAGGAADDIPDALVRGPRQLFTTEWPSPAVPTVVGVVGAFVAAVTAIAVELAGRRRLHLAPLAPLAVGWAVVLALGAPVRPPLWVVAAVGASSLALAMLRFRPDRARRFSHVVLADRTIAVTLVGVLVATTVTGVAVAWADRADPRRTEDAQSNAPVLNSIEQMVALRRADPIVDLYEITDRSELAGQSLPARWRIAALDAYDGQRWTPRLTLRPIGGRLGIAEPVTRDRPAPLRYLVEFLTDDLTLLPFPGRPLAASVDVETDLERTAVSVMDQPDDGTTVLVESEVGLTSRSDIGTEVTSRQVDDLAANFSDLARRLGGDGDQIDALRRIEAMMRDEWSLDEQTPGGGQQFALIELFLTDTQRGTEEQFVTGFVLLARALGMDARVATGFVAPPGSISRDLRIDSEMAAVWPEVRIADGTWVAFDPVPDTETVTDDDAEPQTDAQSPAPAQPPVQPPVDEPDEPDEETEEFEAASNRWRDIRTALVRGGIVLSIGVLPIAAAVAAVLGVKWARRRRRLRHRDPAQRIRGAWANATDSLVDAGLAIAPSWTDDRIARNAATLAPSIPADVRRLAAMSSRMTFGTSTGAIDVVDDAVSTSDEVDSAIRSRLTRGQRIRWRLSLRSLRKRTRSPVVVVPPT